jgi:hypothetical protein
MSESIAGTDWQPAELDAIIADYFDMLAADLEGRPYVKTRHRERMISQLGRSNGSIEYKYQNISAVLNKLGSPWIPGYKPANNHQGALLDAIDRYLTEHAAALDVPIIEPPSLPVLADVFVPMPPVAIDDGRESKRLTQLIRKYDPVERDNRNRSLGKAGEAFVFDLEQRRLHAADRADLAHKVRWVADVDGDGAGYDVLSFDPVGNERLLEVKTTNGSSRTPFFISRNEYAVSAERSDHWRLYRVHMFANSPHVFVLSPPLDMALNLTTEVWRASL